jgi:hypothetical protein
MTESSHKAFNPNGLGNANKKTAIHIGPNK